MLMLTERGQPFAFHFFLTLSGWRSASLDTASTAFGKEAIPLPGGLEATVLPGSAKIFGWSPLRCLSLRLLRRHLLLGGHVLTRQVHSVDESHIVYA
jgi:hypothetical protein